MSNDAKTMKKSRRTLTPKLRFPEFKNNGEWEEKPLGELAQFASGGTPSKTDPKFWDGEIPWISASAMHNSAVYDSEFGVTQEAIGNGTRLAAKGSILILVRGSMLFKRVPICIAERDVAFNQDVKSIRPKRGIVTRYLLNHLIASESRIAINATGIGAGKIETEHLKSFTIGVPSSAEQQKIAECLSSLDGLIAAEGRKLEALKAHKKGLMQQLFPQPGQSQPRLRFPEFRDQPGWKYSKLVKITDELRDGDWIQSKDQSDQGIRIVQTGNIGEGVFIQKSDNARFITSDTFTRLNCREVFPGDCLISRLPDPIGRCCLVPDIGGRMVTAVDCAIIRFDSAQMMPYFFVAYSQTSSYLLEADALGSGSTRKRISRENLSRIAVPVPELKEQQRIAACLTDLDKQVAAQATKIATLKQHTRGLMQQIFPAPEDD